MVDSFPPHLEEVPMDVPIKLYFNQPVLPGEGFLFVSEYSNDQYTNSYNLPANKASFGGSFPYEVAWSASLFSLKNRPWLRPTAFHWRPRPHRGTSDQRQKTQSQAGAP